MRPFSSASSQSNEVSKNSSSAWNRGMPSPGVKSSFKSWLSISAWCLVKSCTIVLMTTRPLSMARNGLSLCLFASSYKTTLAFCRPEFPLVSRVSRRSRSGITRSFLVVREMMSEMAPFDLSSRTASWEGKNCGNRKSNSQSTSWPHCREGASQSKPSQAKPSQASTEKKKTSHTCRRLIASQRASGRETHLRSSRRP